MSSIAARMWPRHRSRSAAPISKAKCRIRRRGCPRSSVYVGGPPPVLREEQGESPPSGSEIVRGGIYGQQVRVDLDAVVEAIDETLEEGATTDDLVEGR